MVRAMRSRRVFPLPLPLPLHLLAFALLLACARSEAAKPDLLPSWNDGPAKRAILDFVRRVTTADGRDYIPPAERIATFDNDGTLWPEQPVVQAAFLMARV